MLTITKVDPSTAPCVTNSGALRIPHKFEGEPGNVPTWINQLVVPSRAVMAHSVTTQ